MTGPEHIHTYNTVYSCKVLMYLFVRYCPRITLTYHEPAFLFYVIFIDYLAYIIAVLENVWLSYHDVEYV